VNHPQTKDWDREEVELFTDIEHPTSHNVTRSHKSTIGELRAWEPYPMEKNDRLYRIGKIVRKP
jgi:hypothetical protein